MKLWGCVLRNMDVCEWLKVEDLGWEALGGGVSFGVG